MKESRYSHLNAEKGGKAPPVREDSGARRARQMRKREARFEKARLSRFSSRFFRGRLVPKATHKNSHADAKRSLAVSEQGERQEYLLKFGINFRRLGRPKG